MNRPAFGRRSLNAQRPRVDRFVVPREMLPDLCRKVHWPHDKCLDDVWYTKYIQQKKYAQCLDEAFGLEPRPDKEESVPAWPCIPRKRSYLSSADSILDLPTYSYAEFPDLLDWCNDILVAALGRNYHKWSWRSQNLISKGFTDADIHCCKFDPKGKLLLLGTDMEMVEIHDNELSKCIERARCKCSSEQFCSITALDWSPTGNAFITGCSNGTLVSYTHMAQVISHRATLPSAALSVRVSPDARYVTAAALHHHVVMLLSWPELDLYSTLDAKWTVKALTWHPWRSALLCVGAVASSGCTRVALWDVPTRVTRRRTLTRCKSTLDAMLFSNRTGELVLSLWDLDRETSETSNCSQLVVMSDPDTMVDQWGEGRSGLDRVRTMLMSPDGTKLATATVDEDLIIWNFLPDDKKKGKNICKKFCAIPTYLDKAEKGYSLR